MKMRLLFPLWLQVHTQDTCHTACPALFLSKSTQFKKQTESLIARTGTVAVQAFQSARVCNYNEVCLAVEPVTNLTNATSSPKDGALEAALLVGRGQRSNIALRRETVKMRMQADIQGKNDWQKALPPFHWHMSPAPTRHNAFPKPERCNGDSETTPVN